MKELSVFVDESGDFGSDSLSKYYIVAFVLHEQDADISNLVRGLDTQLKNTTHEIHPVHTMPLIRRESFYKNDTIEERQHLFKMLYHFARKAPLSYMRLIADSSKAGREGLRDEVSSQTKVLVKKHLDYFSKFDKIILYYDQGQRELSRILFSVFSTLPTMVEFRTIKPSDYKLFQVADLICSLSLLELKASEGRLSKSEKDFVGNRRELKKNYLSKIEKKML